MLNLTHSITVPVKGHIVNQVLVPSADVVGSESRHVSGLLRPDPEPLSSFKFKLQDFYFEFSRLLF